MTHSLVVLLGISGCGARFGDVYIVGRIVLEYGLQIVFIFVLSLLASLRMTLGLEHYCEFTICHYNLSKLNDPG